MRIISKFRDFYDGLQNPADKFCWIREQKEVNISDVYGHRGAEPDICDALRHTDSAPYTNRNRYRGGSSDIDYQAVILGFCGKLYPYVIETHAGVFKHLLRERGAITNIRETWGLKRSECPLIDVTTQYSSYFQKIFYTYDTPVYAFLFNRASTVWRVSVKIVINPSLKELFFQKILDAQQTYQEIEMYLTNDLVKDESKTQVNPEHRMGTRFDKWSFRRMPEK